MSFELRDAVVVLTGAASGIGAELAVQLANAGSHMALIDQNADGLATTRRRIFTAVNVSCHVVDLADRTAIASLPQAVIAAHGRVTMLISNAGAALIGPFEDYGQDDFERLMEVNFWAGVRLSRGFMPLLRQAPMAQLTFVSSVFGLIGAPGSVAYCASKFAIRGFAEALGQELRHTGIRVTLVHPGGLDTNIVRAAKVAERTARETADEAARRFQKLLRHAPDAAARKIIEGIRQRKRRVLVGFDSHVIDILKRLAPSQSDRMMGRLGAKMEPPPAEAPVTDQQVEVLMSERSP
jgi:short-subunit dehydrogenase